MSAGSVLILDKPSGPTSRRAVSMVKEAVGAVKAGHAGALDPLATGVLVVCLDRATLLSAYLGGGWKIYEVTAVLGVETDTYDTEGTVTGGSQAGGVTPEDLLAAAVRLTGTIEQLPPPFSAVKVNGRPMHRYARMGAEVRPPVRSVRVQRIELADFERSGDIVRARMEVECGPGTYVRAIVNDIGKYLGCGACVERLRRTVSEPFSLKDAASMSDVLEIGESAIEAISMTMEIATEGMDTLVVGSEGALGVKLGRPLESGAVKSGRLPLEREARVLAESGELLAIYGPPRLQDAREVGARAVRVIRPAEGTL